MPPVVSSVAPSVAVSVAVAVGVVIGGLGVTCPLVGAVVAVVVGVAVAVTFAVGVPDGGYVPPPLPLLLLPVDFSVNEVEVVKSDLSVSPVYTCTFTSSVPADKPLVLITIL